MSTSSSPQLVRHVIYFPDGDVAVASTKASDDEGKIIHVFCIHTSTIASHSTHFADDLREKARSPSIDSYSGIPLVRYSDETKFLECMCLPSFRAALRRSLTPFTLNKLYSGLFTTECQSFR